MAELANHQTIRTFLDKFLKVRTVATKQKSERKRIAPTTIILALEDEL